MLRSGKGHMSPGESLTLRKHKLTTRVHAQGWWTRAAWRSPAARTAGC